MKENTRFNLIIIMAIVLSISLSVSLSFMLITPREGQMGPEGPLGPQGPRGFEPTLDELFDWKGQKKIVDCAWENTIVDQAINFTLTTAMGSVNWFCTSTEEVTCVVIVRKDGLELPVAFFTSTSKYHADCVPLFGSGEYHVILQTITPIDWMTICVWEFQSDESVEPAREHPQTSDSQQRF